MISTDERSSPLGMFMLGLMFGVAAGGIGVYVWQQREMQRRSARVEADAAKEIQAGRELAGAILTPVTNSPNSSASIDDKIRKLGDDCVEDLRVDRLLSVYRLTTHAYQQRMPREQFDEMVHKVAKLRNISTAATLRESKVRKGPDGKRFEYYCTAHQINATAVVNIALTFVDSDGEWRIDEIELRQDS
jgi:hypothetical protein